MNAKTLRNDDNLVMLFCSVQYGLLLLEVSHNDAIMTEINYNKQFKMILNGRIKMQK
jgi:hypothetical protein